MTDDEPYSACADIGPDGFACELPRGHDGRHQALAVDEEWFNFEGL